MVKTIFKCKMCGGQLEFEEGDSVCECEYCGSKQTLPKVMDENLQNLFNRANVLRMKAEFDKAAEIYEKILQASGTEAEAYWGLILCKYGIEYVEDPATYKRVPTCHRASFDAVTADDDYKMAMEYADMSQRGIYEAEAKVIDDIQKGIVALAQKEEPYDVFICYKESGEDGKRTVDSVIANDIYHQLTQEGFKVFYAAITLEDKLGQEYEPYIFSALNSAKVMLSIGTKPEYFNAVWVKNEWSRFLKIMKKDRARMMIPCYKDMEAYELPEEFAHLQAQDMSKIGFINDIVRGIKKVIVKDEPQNVVEQQVIVQQAAPVNSNIQALLDRGNMALEDGEWEKADGFFEEVLNQDAQCAEAYLGKLLVELKVASSKRIVLIHKRFDTSKNYQKFLRFADSEQKSEVEEALKAIDLNIENDRKDSTYWKAMKCKDNEDYRTAIELFSKIPDYKDANMQLEFCDGFVGGLDKRVDDIAYVLWRDYDRRLKTSLINLCHKMEELNQELGQSGSLTRVRKKEITSHIEELRLFITKKNDKITEIARVIQEQLERELNNYSPKLSYEEGVSLLENNTIRAAFMNKYLKPYLEPHGIIVQNNFIQFGRFKGMPIIWKVLDVKNGKWLIICNTCLDATRVYHLSFNFSWECCKLRYWLNTTFFNESFENNEKNVISTTHVSIDDDFEEAVKSDNSTMDRVFILSRKEIEKYYKSNEERRCGFWGEGNAVTESLRYWLRSPRLNDGTVDCVNEYGRISSCKYNYLCGVRPAMWIDFENI